MQVVKMRIAFVTQRYGGPGGGIERVVEELAKRFCHEHEVHVYAQSIVRGDEHLPIYYHRIPFRARSWSLNQVLFFFLSYFYLLRHRYDIVHLHAPSLYRKGIVTCHGIPQAALLRLRQFDQALLRREVPFKQIRRFIFMRPIIEYNFKRGRHKHVIAISSTIYEDLITICKTPPEHISFIPNGFDVQRFTRVSRVMARQKVVQQFG
ncbi:MAG: hypothetical protein D6736_18890, partial [Nitrospinota bacterium]